MEGLSLKHSGGRVEATASTLHGEFALSNASWFYLVVISLCFLGLAICFSCKKVRHRLLGLDEETSVRSEREAVLPKRSSLNGPPDHAEPSLSPRPTLGLRSGTRVDKDLDIEMTELPPLPSNPPPTPESDFLD